MREFAGGVNAVERHERRLRLGEVLKRAGRRLVRTPTNRRGVVRDLWSIRNDSFGGLTRPLTFTENLTVARRDVLVR